VDRRAIWIVASLVGGYIFCQLLADVAATKLVRIGDVVLPAGTFIFAVTFALRDMIHKRLGKEWARTSIWLAGILNVFMALYLWAVAMLPAPYYYALAEAWSQIFTLVPAIVFASITAELVSELINTEVYHWWWRTREGFP
jgi:uncharacterized integral membrane protein (TIGR00697 family)